MAAAQLTKTWRIPPTGGGSEESRSVEELKDDELRDPMTQRLGLKLDLSMLPLHRLPWSIVFTNTVSGVTVLNINASGLKTLPSEINVMSKLKRLRLFSNDLETLPAEIGDLQYLERLNVYGNKLRQLPWQLRKLSSLKILRLGGNQLSQDDFNAIQNLAKLQKLYVRENQRMATIPRAVCQLPSLIKINAEDCAQLRTPPLQVIRRGIDSVREYALQHYW